MRFWVYILSFFVFFFCLIGYIAQNPFSQVALFFDMSGEPVPQKLSAAVKEILQTVRKMEQNGAYPVIPNKEVDWNIYPAFFHVESEEIMIGAEKKKRVLWKKDRWYLEILDGVKITKSIPLSDRLASFDYLQNMLHLMAEDEKKIEEKYFYWITFHSEKYFEVLAKREKAKPGMSPYEFSQFPEIYRCKFIKNKWFFYGGGITLDMEEDQ